MGRGYTSAKVEKTRAKHEVERVGRVGRVIHAWELIDGEATVRRRGGDAKTAVVGASGHGTRGRLALLAYSAGNLSLAGRPTSFASCCVPSSCYPHLQYGTVLYVQHADEVCAFSQPIVRKKKTDLMSTSV